VNWEYTETVHTKFTSNLYSKEYQQASPMCYILFTVRTTNNVFSAGPSRTDVKTQVHGKNMDWLHYYQINESYDNPHCNIKPHITILKI